MKRDRKKKLNRLRDVNLCTYRVYRDVWVMVVGVTWIPTVPEYTNITAVNSTCVSNIFLCFIFYLQQSWNIGWR